MNNWDSSYKDLGDTNDTNSADSQYTGNGTPVSENGSNIYGYIDNILPKQPDDRYIIEAGKSLRQLLKYPFASKEYDGQPDRRYNDAERVDIVRDERSRTVRCPVRFYEVLKFIEQLRGKRPSIGFKYKAGTTTNYVHFLFEDNEEGWVYVDSQRSLNVRQVHKMEKILDHTGLNKVAVIANKIGTPARQEVSRINSERGKIIELHRYDTIYNHSLHDFF